MVCSGNTFMSTREDDGFTLVEMVVALAVVSFALAGILAATNLVTRHNQQMLRLDRAVRAAEEARSHLYTALSPYGPFDTNNLTGGERTVDYDCGKSRCQFRLASAGQRLVYVSEGEVLRSWPPKLVAEGREQRLEVLILQDLSGTTLGLVRLETEQAEDCQFDMISRTCRGEGRESTP
jgi:prepilin-type N-terminal cleavage/methylation domain-containing protein